MVRLITVRSRIVCRECRTTWRLNSPQHFAKLKHRRRNKVKASIHDYSLVAWETVQNLSSTDEITEVVSQWQQEGKTHICLDFSQVLKLNLHDRSRLVKISRKLKSISGDLIVSNTSDNVTDEMWSYNLGFLIATHQQLN